MAELTLLSRRYERAPRRPPALVATKLRPPAPPPDAIARPRLEHRLDEGEGCALTVVAAPAGYGKTTLLAQWARGCDRPVAWVTLDERDRDAFRLWAHVGAALATALPALEPLTRPGLPLDRLLPALADAAAAGRPAVLVLDDHHRLGRGAAEATLRWFAEQTGPRLQVVVASRLPPPFPVGLLRARGRLVQIGPRQLRLTDMEAHAVGRGDDDADGWPAGAERAATVAAQALAGLSPDERRFLAEASQLALLEAAACDEILGRDGSRALLRELERRTPFLVQLDGDAWRLHTAFAAALEHERPASERLDELHRRAAAWHRRCGDLDAAIDHALAARDWRGAAAVLRRTWRRDPQALARLERIPDDAVPARLELARAWLLELAGRSEEAEAALGAAAAKAPQRALPLVDRESALLRGAFGRGPAPAGGGAVGAWSRGLALWLRGLDPAAELEAARSGPPPVACAATALLARVSPDRDAAERLARTAAALASGHEIELSLVPAALGAALAARGADEEALPLLERAVELARERGRPLELVDALLLLAPPAAARDGRPRAAALLAEAAALLEESGDPGTFARRLDAARARALPRPGARGSDLTARERAVVRLLATDRTKREIAVELHLSFNTVHSHVKSIYRKLGAASRSDAVARAAAEGLC